MNYRSELRKYKKQRKKYRPVMSMLLDLHDTAGPADVPIAIADQKDMLIILELIDIGYLDPEALIVKKKFGDIAGVAYNGKFPFTEKGTVLFRAERPSGISDFFKALFYFFNRIVKCLL
jgi:hypothetical protein